MHIQKICMCIALVCSGSQLQRQCTEEIGGHKAPGIQCGQRLLRFLLHQPLALGKAVNGYKGTLTIGSIRTDGFPSSCWEPISSSMSSRIWNAIPSAIAKFPAASICASLPPPSTAPIWQAARIRSPVLCQCTCRSWLRSGSAARPEDPAPARRPCRFLRLPQRELQRSGGSAPDRPASVPASGMPRAGAHRPPGVAMSSP